MLPICHNMPSPQSPSQILSYVAASDCQSGPDEVVSESKDEVKHTYQMEPQTKRLQEDKPPIDGTIALDRVRKTYITIRT